MTGETSAPTSRRSLLLILLVTAVFTLLWSHTRLLDQDEVFVLQTDSVHSVAELINVERHYPISLDPLFYHLLGHASTSILGPTAFAIRLPSLLGYLLLQICVFFIARRIAGDRAGVIAAAVTALTATTFYAVQARPYGVLLGLAALILLSWQHATRDGAGKRTGWFITLTIAIMLALNTHYFAILLLIPLCTAELFRIVRNRRIDWPVVAAILLGMAGEVLTLPFQKAAGEFRKHYYNAGRVGLHAITQGYRALFINYTDYPMRTQHLIMGVLIVLAVIFIVAIANTLRKQTINLPPAEAVFLIVLAALPFFGFLLAHFVTHSFEVRYVLSAIIALAVLIGAVTAPAFQSERALNITAAILLIAIIGAGAERVREEHRKTDELLAALQMDAATQAALAAHPGPIYIQNLGNFDEYGAYITDPALKQRLTLLYSSTQEIALNHHDTQALTAEHMTHFTAAHVSSYEQMRQQPGEHLVILYHGGGWNWLDTALASSGATVTPLGHLFNGDLAAVRIPGGN